MKTYIIDKKDKKGAYIYITLSCLLAEIAFILFTYFVLRETFNLLFAIISFSLIVAIPIFMIMSLSKVGKYRFELVDKSFKIYLRDRLKIEYNLEKTRIDFIKLYGYKHIQLLESGIGFNINEKMVGKELFAQLEQDIQEFNTAKRNYNIVSNEERKESYYLPNRKDNFVIIFLKCFLTVYAILMFIVVVVLGFVIGDDISIGIAIASAGLIVAIIILVTIKIIKNNRYKKLKLQNDEIGFLNIPYNYFTNVGTRYRVISGPMNDDSVIKSRNRIFKNTYCLKTGEYEVSVVISINSMLMSEQSLDTTIKFTIEKDKYYILSYNKLSRQYSFSEAEVPNYISKKGL